MDKSGPSDNGEKKKTSLKRKLPVLKLSDLVAKLVDLGKWVDCLAGTATFLQVIMATHNTAETRTAINHLIPELLYALGQVRIAIRTFAQDYEEFMRREAAKQHKK